MGINKYQCLTPDVPQFHPGNKRLLDKDNDDNTETTDTSQSERDDMSHTYQDHFIEKVKKTKNTNDDNKYKENTSRYQGRN